MEMSETKIRQCSTPFGIRGRITQLGRQGLADLGLVLNAFRHQRQDHVDESAPRIGKVEPCSTPFGIRGRITTSRCLARPWRCSGAQRLSASEAGSLLHWRQPHPDPKGAQRLSASEAGSHGQALVDFLTQPKCSTPFGIRGRITQEQEGGKRAQLRVLNAFRHQRQDHQSNWNGYLRVLRVLNAFRHQRQDHIASPALLSPGPWVLNAFRHQRQDHYTHLCLIGYSI